MRIVDLLSPKAMQLGAHPADKAAAIDALVDLHEAAGNLVDKEKYKQAILAREELGTTAVGEGIAIPHAKTDATKHAALAAMTAPDGVDYGAPDGQPSTLLFMIAAPDDGGEVHLEVLSRLMTILMDIDFRKSLMEAATPEEFLKLIDAKENERFADEVKQDAVADMEGNVEGTEYLIDEAKAEHREHKVEKEEAQAQAEGYRILAVTACPTGIAHTYMAAEALVNAADARGIALKAETNGSGGTKNKLTNAEIEAADGIIVAADKEVSMDRFDGKPVVIVKVADGINKPDELIDRVLDGNAKIYHSASSKRVEDETGSDESVGRKIYKHLMEGVSHMLPFVVSGGLFIAVAFLIDSIAGVPQDSSFGTGTPVSAWFKTIGGFAFSFMVPILAAYIAKSIADRPGLVVGFVGGFMATLGSTFGLPGGDVPSGFLGGLLAGFAGGYMMLGIEKLCDKMPDSLAGIKQILIYPLAGLAAISLFMCLVGPIMGAINTAMSDALTWLADNDYGIILGIILGAMMAIDMGGPFNKAAYVFGTGMLSLGTDAAYEIMASVMIGGMVPPLAIALSTTLFKNRWTEEERKNGPVNYIMGLSFITEGAIPYAASDPLRVIPACIIGSGVAGGLSWLFGCTLMAPHGGIFVVPVIGNALMYLVALAIGAVVGMLMLAILKKKQ
ncbi:PTS fructose transporter subunit IIABC [Anaerotardibacter muris]|uniref:PTS fructose transporter subunit IIABC n=1 Tax=Anaerotardibacter muris TaxID=2941505 RepID=UPI002041CA26|nr:fructose-specific PTS transporter subunit EIIC [Anaerotardibacter muris]